MAARNAKGRVLAQARKVPKKTAGSERRPATYTKKPGRLLKRQTSLTER